jgi:hypothetical protein
MLRRSDGLLVKRKVVVAPRQPVRSWLLILGMLLRGWGKTAIVVVTRNVCGLLMWPQQSLSVAHLMGLDKSGDNSTRNRGLPRYGMLIARASWLSDTAAGRPRLRP